MLAAWYSDWLCRTGFLYVRQIPDDAATAAQYARQIPDGVATATQLSG